MSMELDCIRIERVAMTGGATRLRFDGRWTDIRGGRTEEAKAGRLPGYSRSAP
jgi:hypothetical protein